MTQDLSKPVGLMTGLNKFKARITNREDTEHVAILMRYGIMVTLVSGFLFILGFILTDSIKARTFFDDMLPAAGLYLSIVTLQMVHMLVFTRPSPMRRLVSIGNDLWLLTLAALNMGPEGIGLYPFYYWLILAAGFRYGAVYLLASALLSILSLMVVFHQFDLWLASPVVCVVQVGGIVILTLAIRSFLTTIKNALEGEKTANNAKSTFLANISHEVRTPLNAIKGLSDLLGDTALTSEQRRMVATISESGTSLLTLINQLLDYSRMESGKMPETEEDFDLFVMFGRIHRLFHLQARNKQIAFNIHVDPAMRRLFHGNRRFIEDVLVNLLGNAVKFTETGSVTLSATLLEEQPRSHRVRFDVMDTGIGIPPEAQGRIFNSFTQSEDNIIDSYGGSGLGLALCREYVQSLGGSISVASTVGKGSCFSVTLTLQRMDYESRQQALRPILGEGPALAVLSDDNALFEQVKKSHANSVAYAGLQQAVTGLKGRMSSQDAALILVIDRSYVDGDMAYLASMVRRLAGDATIHLIWLCDDHQAPGDDASSLAHYGLAFVSQTDLNLYLGKLVRLSAYLQIIQDTQTQPGEDKRTDLRILVADDNPTNQMVIEKMLDSRGHFARVVESGEAALEAVRQETFDIVFLDINMPGICGLETARRVRALQADGVIANCPPMLALTADSSPEMELKCKDAGMVACLHKPIDRLRLDELIDQFAISNNITIIDETAKTEPDTMLAINTLKDLHELGGDDFLVSLAHQFSQDGIMALKRLSAAVRDCDETDFKDEAHALRSAAANIGAEAVFKLCLSWRDITAAELHQEGTSHVLELSRNMDQSIEALEHHLSITLPRPPLVCESAEQAPEPGISLAS